MDPYELGIESDIITQARSARLGEGFNSFSLQRLHENTLFSKEGLKTVESHINPDMNLYFEVSESSQELATKLGIHAQVAASYMGNKVEGSADYLNEKESTASSLYVTIRGKAVYRSEVLEISPETKKTILDYLREPADLVETYGDYYCSQLDYGAELIIFLKVTANSIQEKQSIATNLKTSLKLGSVGVDAEAKMQSNIEATTKEAHTEFHLYQSGALSAPENESLAGLMKYWRTYITKENCNSLVSATYSPWTRFALEGDISVSDATKIKRHLKETLVPAWKIRDRYLNLIAGYYKILDQYKSAYKSGFYTDESTDDQYAVYIPTEYFKLIRADIIGLTTILINELEENAGSINLRDPYPLIQARSTDLPDLIIKGKIIEKGLPEYYEEKLKKRKILYSSIWGGGGGDQFHAACLNGEGLTKIGLMTYNQPNVGWVISKFYWYGKGKDGKIYGSKDHGTKNGDPTSLELNQGDYIEEVEVKSDSSVRQIKFTVRRHGKEDPEIVSIIGNLDPSLETRVKTYKLSDIRLVDFFGRSGNWLDAIGIHYIAE